MLGVGTVDLSIALGDVGDVALRGDMGVGGSGRLDESDVAVDADALGNRG